MTDQTTYAVMPTYAAGHTDETSFRNLTAGQAEICAGAFLRDLTHLQGEGITRLVVEVER